MTPSPHARPPDGGDAALRAASGDRDRAVSGGRAGGMRLDELARRAGVATTTVRLYQNRGLLPGPRLEGRTGYYDEAHLARLGLVGRLQEQGFSLAGIARLLETWEGGGDLDDLLGAETELHALLEPRAPVVIEPADLLGRFPPGSVGPELMDRAVAVGLAEPTDDGWVRIPDPRFLDTGPALVELGIPVTAVLDEWDHLVTATDEIARRFVALFEEHLAPQGWQDHPDAVDAPGVARTLARLRHHARQVTVAALDRSLARQGAHRPGTLLGERGG